METTKKRKISDKYCNYCGKNLSDPKKDQKYCKGAWCSAKGEPLTLILTGLVISAFGVLLTITILILYEYLIFSFFFLLLFIGISVLVGPIYLLMGLIGFFGRYLDHRRKEETSQYSS